MSNQHAIIAGVNKCGTTSVFRYLADHPDVCASSIKETRFFNAVEETKNVKLYEDYLDYCNRILKFTFTQGHIPERDEAWHLDPPDILGPITIITKQRSDLNKKLKLS